MKTVLRGENLRLAKGDRIILDVPEVEVREGEVLALIGRNGAGKSSLLLVLAGLEEKYEGQLFFAGQRVTPASLVAYRRHLAVVFQEPLLLSTSVRANVEAGLRLRGLADGPAREQADVWMVRLGLAALARRPAWALSGGEAQRVALARALVCQPQVLFLDEPFASLDAPTRNTLLEDLQEILAATRVTTVFVTHDYRELPLLAGRVAVMEGGRVIQDGTPEEVLTRPATLAVAELVGVENRLPGRLGPGENGRPAVALGSGLKLVAAVESVHPGPVSPEGGRVAAVFRPEEVVLRPAGANPAGGGQAGPDRYNCFPAQVTRVLPAGAQDKIIIEASGTEVVALVEHRRARAWQLQPGCPVEAEIDPEAVHLIPY
ncbi:MAG: ABC transporter ATP-binding protein [Clostridia bacterium]|nr:MAG: ABC transporter ATP-binding protein [Clostridia bacterium]